MGRNTCYLGLLLCIFALNESYARADYQIGCGKTDITGPALGIQLWGFVKEGQVSEGIHFRQWSRAFVIADTESKKRIALVSVDLGSITHAIHLSVIERLKSRYGDVYSLENTLLSATHTHAAPGGHWQRGAGSPMGSKFVQEYYDVIVDGIVDSIAVAHDDLQRGTILINSGIVENAGANRSLAAYINNPASERERYDADTDREMTLLKFAVNARAIGAINWFAVHPTAMTYNNRLISGDHKGHASYLMESKLGNRDGQFVAAFAQSNCGDVTPNLNLDNTGPGENEFQTTRIIARRQVDVAMEIFDNASEALSGPIDYRQCFMNMVYRPVDKKFSGIEGARTCPSAYGYSFAAGSTEDGGGHPMFREGMLTRSKLIDGLVKQQLKAEPPTEECRECHGKKVILIATGETKPKPAYTQVLPITLVRIGQLGIVAVPAEFTTMAGRRLRETVSDVLRDVVQHVVLAGYCNDYAGYVTTKEEYDTQQYEGGHTLYGPWTLAAYQQEFTRMAEAMRDGKPFDSGALPEDVRGTATAMQLEANGNESNQQLGAVTTPPSDSYDRSSVAIVVFTSAHPQNAYPQTESFLRVQREADGQWQDVADDDDWETKCRWVNVEEDSSRLALKVEWKIPADIDAGKYRIGHTGSITDPAGTVKRFEGFSPSFTVNE